MITASPAFGPLAAVNATECLYSPVMTPRVPFMSPVLRDRFLMQIKPKEVSKEEGGGKGSKKKHLCSQELPASSQVDGH